MRCCVVVIALAWIGFVAAGAPSRAASAGEKFPYTAYTNSDDVYIRSGPGKNYYPTDKLAKGEPVEVYRQDPGGWYAIRPPQGSFSWVPSEALKPIGDHLAVVQKDHTPCLVGTRFSNARDVHQVRLDQGEQVEILDIKQLGDGADAQSWCQIAPPSGEFRWVFGKFIDRDLPPGVSNSEKSRRPPDEDDRTAQNPGWTAKGTVKSIAADGADSSASSAAPRRDSNWHSNSKSTVADERPAPMGDPFQSELSSIDLEVSKIASDDQSTWEFTALRRRAEALLPHADTALERGRVRLVLNRIARFEDVKHRYDLLNQPGSAIASNRPSVLPVDDPNRYDGVGKLAPVVSQRPNAPRYALIDDSNQVVSFVTPAPGVDLQAYVGKSVGVSGQRGFMPELGKPHVTAQRVALVDTPTLR
jgi:Bacterial SH3 domain